MDTQSIREKLMGRVQLIERRNDNNESVIHCFGALGQSGVAEADVLHLCGFYAIPWELDGGGRKRYWRQLLPPASAGR